MNDPAIAQRLDANVKLAHDLGIDGTPVLVIGDAMIPGAVDASDIERAIGSARATARN
jgi:protein-disulfide isomerase